MDKMAEVATIEEELQKMHSGKYTDQQLRSWAHFPNEKTFIDMNLRASQQAFFCSSHKSAHTSLYLGIIPWEAD